MLKRLLLFQPRLIGALLIHDDCAAHGMVPNAAQFSAQGLVSPGSGWNKPEIGDLARNNIHLGPELGDIEVMQHVYGTEQHLDGLTNGEV